MLPLVPADTGGGRLRRVGVSKTHTGDQERFKRVAEFVARSLFAPNFPVDLCRPFGARAPYACR